MNYIAIFNMTTPYLMILISYIRCVKTFIYEQAIGVFGSETSL